MLRALGTIILALATTSPALACDLCHNFGCPDCWVAADSAPADAAALGYGPTRAGWPQPGGKGQPVFLTYSYQNLHEGALLDPAGNPVPFQQIRTAIEEALSVWSAVAPLHFIEVEDDHLPYGGSTAGRKYGQLRFRHAYINGPDPPTGNPTTKAQAFYPGPSLNAGDVEFDRGDPWALVGTQREPDLLGAAIHEIGHALGLTHSTLPEANMYWIFRRHTGPGSGTLADDDIAAIRSIYGEGVGSVAPLTVASIPDPAFAGVLLLALIGVAARWQGRHAGPFA